MNIKDKKSIERKLENIRILLSYKTFECKRENCPFRDNSNHAQNTRCEFFHKQDDLRRFPFVNPPEFFLQNTSLLEKLTGNPSFDISLFFRELIQSQSKNTNAKLELAYGKTFGYKSAEDNECRNLDEYFYHPLNYKTLPCEEDAGCQTKFCPKYHTPDEKRSFEITRECFEEPNKLLRKVEEVHANFKGTLESLIFKIQCSAKESPNKSEQTNKSPAEKQAEKEADKNQLDSVKEAPLRASSHPQPVQSQAHFSPPQTFQSPFMPIQPLPVNFALMQEGLRNQFASPNFPPLHFMQSAEILKNNQFFIPQQTNLSLKSFFEPNFPSQDHLRQSSSLSGIPAKAPPHPLPLQDTPLSLLQLKPTGSRDSALLGKKPGDLGDNKSTERAEPKEAAPGFSPRAQGPNKRTSSQTVSQPHRPSSTAPRDSGSSQNNFNPHSKKNVVKIANQLCRPNASKVDKFVLNKEVDFYESIHVEFKHFALLNLKTVTSYICAYLNSYGGTMFFGINDSGIVKGIQLQRKDIDLFQVNLDIALRNFQPRVMPDQVRLTFHEICVDESRNHVLLDRYVVQIDTFCAAYDNFYTTDENSFVVKRNGSINHLIPTEIVQFVKERYNPLITDVNLAQRLNPAIFERLSRDELERLIVNLQQSLDFASQHLRQK